MSFIKYAYLTGQHIGQYTVCFTIDWKVLQYTTHHFNRQSRDTETNFIYAKEVNCGISLPSFDE